MLGLYILKVNEIFYSIQGEGKNAGVAMVFIRLSGCNLRCSFCDTAYAFDAGREMPESEIVAEVKRHQPDWVCITGGEPFLQDLRHLIHHLKLEGFNVQIETNGTTHQPVDCDWLVVSPKTEKEPDGTMLKRSNEIKVVVDSPEILKRAKAYEQWGSYHSVQPQSNREDMTRLCVEFVKQNPNWHLSMQLHKFIGIE